MESIEEVGMENGHLPVNRGIKMSDVGLAFSRLLPATVRLSRWARTTVGDAVFTAPNAGAARTTLGSTAVGDELFVASSAEAARAAIGVSVGIPDVIVEEQQASGTNGGGATSGSFFTRALNTLTHNFNSIASIASNQVTLGAGTYFFKWSAPGYLIGQHKTQILNVTDSAVVGIGTSEYSQPNASFDSCMTSSVGSSVVTIAASKAFALQHRVTSTRATNGLGLANGFGVEVYSRLEITKIG
jgi:hypothetical protein